MISTYDTMPRFALSFFGAFAVLRDNRPVTRFESDRIRALLAYLAIERDRPHRRTALAHLLWPEHGEAAARHSLSQALFVLRKVLERGTEPPLLHVTRQEVHFRPADHVWLDVAAFSHALRATATHTHGDVVECRLCVDRLRQAAELYRGPLLQHVVVENSAPWDEWLLHTREQLEQQVLEALQSLARFHELAGDYPSAIQYLQRQVVLAPWQEAGHQQLMRVLASAGQRGAALAAYDACRRILRERFGIDPTRETTALREQIRSGAVNMSAALPPHPAPPIAPVVPRPLPHNVPPARTKFIGRTDDVARLLERLLDPACRLVTITGPGGVGKTRLALEVARRVLEERLPRFGDGVYVVALATVDAGATQTPADAGAASASFPARNRILGRIADTLNLALSGVNDPLQQISTILRDAALLLVLDNLEDLLAEVEVLSDVLQTAPHVKILATSRERLNLQEEWLLPLAGMPVPALPAPNHGSLATASATTCDLPANFVDADAIQLFLQYARRFQPAFVPTSDDWRSIARICALVQGLPLGIELAAAWVPMLCCTEIADEIAHNFDFLTTSLRNVPDRHRSMRAVFASSWRLLSCEEQRVLAALSVFRGGFTRAAAAEIAGATLPVLASLEHKSLIQC